MDDKKFKGRLDVSDVIQDGDEDDVNMSAPFSPKTDAHAAAKELFAADGPVKASLMDSIRSFQAEFQVPRVVPSGVSGASLLATP